MTVREQVEAMELGETRDIVFSNGIARSTKELERVEDDEWFIHSTNHGWETASVTLEEAIKFVKGELSSLDLEWY